MMEKKVNDIILCDALYNVTTMCNCKCKHCNPKVYTGKANEMSSKEMIEKFEKSKYLQSNTITVAGGKGRAFELILHVFEPAVHGQTVGRHRGDELAEALHAAVVGKAEAIHVIISQQIGLKVAVEHHQIHEGDDKKHQGL